MFLSPRQIATARPRAVHRGGRCRRQPWPLAGLPEAVSRYKGHEITPSVVNSPAGKVTEAGYTVRKDGTLVHSGVVYGSFDTHKDGLSAAESAARNWVDVRGT